MKFSIKDWGIRKKLIIGYIIINLIPLSLLTIYSYTRTIEFLKTQTDQQMMYDLDLGAALIEQKIEKVSTIANMLYTDKQLSSYLSLDYSDQGFEDMFYYIDQKFANIKALNSEISKICIYSTNKTLPEENFYFYSFDSSPSYIMNRADNQKKIINLNIIEEDGDYYLSLSRVLNYYPSENVVNVLRLDIQIQDILNTLVSDDENKIKFLVDFEGNTIMNSKVNSYIEKEELLNLMKDATKGNIYVSLKKDLKNTHLDNESGVSYYVMYKNQDIINAVKSDSIKEYGFVLLILITTIIVISLFSQYLWSKLNVILVGLREMSLGNLDYKLPDMGKDEMGKIAYSFNHQQKKLKNLIHENYEKQMQLKITELNLLQEQINPHFLYNALSSISYLALRDKSMMTVNSIQSLSEFFRISLNNGHQYLSVSEELNLLKSYLAIQEIRFGEGICVEYDVERDCLNYRIIKLILQPIVENAIHHGRTPDCILHIYIRIYKTPEWLYFEVEDDGLGMPQSKLEEVYIKLDNKISGSGLYNINNRIKLYFGDESNLELISEIGFGTKVTLKIKC